MTLALPPLSLFGGISSNAENMETKIMTKVCTKTTSTDRESVIFSFSDKTTIEVFVKQFDDDIKMRLMLAGISHTLGDAYAGCEGSASKAIALFNTRLSSLKAGNWAAKSGGGILAEALSMASNESLLDCIEVINAMDDKSKKALRASLGVEIAKLELERKVEKAKEAPALNLGALFTKDG